MPFLETSIQCIKLLNVLCLFLSMSITKVTNVKTTQITSSGDELICDSGGLELSDIFLLLVSLLSGFLEFFQRLLLNDTKQELLVRLKKFRRVSNTKANNPNITPNYNIIELLVDSSTFSDKCGVEGPFLVGWLQFAKWATIFIIAMITFFKCDFIGINQNFKLCGWINFIAPFIIGVFEYLLSNLMSQLQGDFEKKLLMQMGKG